MRKVTFGVANSLDNYIAREDGSVDWLLWSKDVSAFVKEFWKPIDTVLIGRLRAFALRSREAVTVGPVARLERGSAQRRKRYERSGPKAV